jgi:hypothetical protein
MWQSDLATYHKQQTDSEDPVVNLATIQHCSFRYLEAVDINLDVIRICIFVGRRASVQNFKLRMRNLDGGFIVDQRKGRYVQKLIF